MFAVDVDVVVDANGAEDGVGEEEDDDPDVIVDEFAASSDLSSSFFWVSVARERGG